VVVEIKNRETDEVIKQIPSEEILELRVKMEELTGMLLDEKI
jgi:flagellar protein FlaG